LQKICQQALDTDQRNVERANYLRLQLKRDDTDAQAN